MSGLMDVFSDDPKPTVKPESTPRSAPSPSQGGFLGSDLPDEVRNAARAAAEAADAESSARAAYDAQREQLTAKVNERLAPLDKSWKDAKEARKEAEEHLLKVMQAEKISKIPMDDRPEIKIKVTPGKKKQVTLSWLKEPEGVVVKTYGPDAPKTIWDAVPKSDPKTEVIVPPRYEDEPSR